MKIPPMVLEKFERSAAGLDYGSASLTVHVKGGVPRYVIQREESFIPADDSSSMKEEGERHGRK
jgi:hypothetical protein